MRLSDYFPIKKKDPPAILEIPEYRKKLLFISYEEPKVHGFGMQITMSLTDNGDVFLDRDCDDPSTIYSMLPACDSKSPKEVQKLSYFPSYSGMLPEQRGMYLRWLYDISKHIDIGYVFSYFYGLERHLVLGDFESAFDEILILRRFHDNSSFNYYSASALVYSCLLRKRADKLEELYQIEGFDYFDNSNLLMLHYSDLDILPEMMLSLANKLTEVNRRYVKLYPNRYKENIEKLLIEKFGKAGYPISAEFSLDDVEDGISYPVFANISLPSEIRSPSIPSFIDHAPFQEKMHSFFKEVHERVKIELKFSRKKSNK